jgi:hypothetical protein
MRTPADRLVGSGEEVLSKYEFAYPESCHLVGSNKDNPVIPA